MQNSQNLSEELLEILQCPAGKGALTQRGDRLVCLSCGLSYPIRDGIPVLLVEEAELPAGVDSIEQIQCLAPVSEPGD